MDTIPRTLGEYRLWWRTNTSIPYGLCWCGCGEQTAPMKTDVPSKGYVAGEPKPFISGHQARVKGQARRSKLEPPNPNGLCFCGCGQKTPIAKQTKSSAGWVQGHPVPYVPQHHNRALRVPEEDELCARYEAGEAQTALANAFGISDSSVTRIVRRRGIEARYRLPLDDQAIIDGYYGGEKIYDLAERLGCHFAQIYYVLRRHGLEASRKPLRLTWDEHEAGRVIRRLPAYRHWRASILDRDGRACTECGTHSTRRNRLHVHHILSFSQILAEYRPVTVEDADSYELLWDTDNGVTLCDYCHRRAHR